MKALILAAGFGKRLRPITDSIPKSLVEVGETPLLINALNILTELGINDIGIVVGHMADKVRDAVGDIYQGASITYFENDRYLVTNNVASLACARTYMDDDMLLMECDLFYRKAMIERLMTGTGDCAILVSPFNANTMDGTVIETEGGKVSKLVLGSWQGEGYNYSQSHKTVNMYRFTKDFAHKYAQLIGWYVDNMGENSYYEKVLGSMIYLQENEFSLVEVPEDMWCEIDDAEDLERARALAARIAE